MQKYLLSAQNVSWLIFSFISAFIILFWYVGFDGFYFYDDYTYSLYAYQFSEGKFSISDDIFSHRFMVFIPTAILYLIFGINDYSTILWPLIGALCSVALVFYLLKSDPFRAAIAVVLLGLCFYPLFFSNKLYPDTVVSFFSFFSVCILFKASDDKYLSKSCAFVFSVFCAFLSKETVIYFFPFYLIIFISDILSGLNKKFWISVAAFALLLFSAYFICYKIYTGSFFFRFEAIESGHYAFPLSYYHRTFTEIIPRLTYEPLLMLLGSEMIIPLIISIPYLFNFRFRHLKDIRTDAGFWPVLVITLLLMIWFGSTSLHHYNPVSLLPRMFILLMPPIVVLASVSLADFLLITSKLMFVAVLFSICSVLAYFVNDKVYLIYCILTGIFMTLFFLHRKLVNGKFKMVLPFLLMGTLCLHPLYTMFKPTQTGYASEKKIINEYLKRKEGVNLVVADPQLCSGYLYYYKFKPDGHYKFLNYKQLSASDLKADRYFVLMNKYSFDLFHSMGDPYPACYSEKPENWKLIGENGNVKLYEAGSLEEVKAGF
ncbi:MAG TPA: glycosyltransferase family 39 protein [Cytophagaceae bacterium]|jgi:hypothetical protein|nr:glycosyltransferase family 39 protein [Cytophagaceae bacterium]